MGGGVASLAHFYLVWTHRGKGLLSVSEHAIADKNSHRIYFASHVVCEAFILMFSYNFYVVEHNVLIPHYLNICFIVFDFVQAALPSTGNTEKIHLRAAYVSWASYITSGTIAFFLLDIVQPFKLASLIFLIPSLCMLVYLNFDKHKKYIYQLAIVPLFVIYLLLVVLGSQ